MKAILSSSFEKNGSSFEEFCEDIAKTEPILLNSRTESYDKP